MTLINCEVNHILKWSSTCVVPNSTGARRFVISDTKLYVPVVLYQLKNQCEITSAVKTWF